MERLYVKKSSKELVEFVGISEEGKVLTRTLSREKIRAYTSGSFKKLFQALKVSNFEELITFEVNLSEQIKPFFNKQTLCLILCIPFCPSYINYESEVKLIELIKTARSMLAWNDEVSLRMHLMLLQEFELIKVSEETFELSYSLYKIFSQIISDEEGTPSEEDELKLKSNLSNLSGVVFEGCSREQEKPSKKQFKNFEELFSSESFGMEIPLENRALVLSDTGMLISPAAIVEESKFNYIVKTPRGKLFSFPKRKMEIEYKIRKLKLAIGGGVDVNLNRLKELR